MLGFLPRISIIDRPTVSIVYQSARSIASVDINVVAVISGKLIAAL